MKPTHFHKAAFMLVALTFILLSCSKRDQNAAFENFIDDELTRLLKHSESVHNETQWGAYMLPDDWDFENLPQDPRNPLTKEKVLLGQMLFHETGCGRDPLKPNVSDETYSCASCHHHRAGFQANLRQGIGEGGIGFGFAGEGRVVNSVYPPELVDVQPVRTPTVLNVAYQKVTLWNGQFGAVGANLDTRHLWQHGTPLETNFLGFHGPETQAIAGMKVHRLMVDMEFCNDYISYQQLFMNAYPDMSPDEMMTNEYAGLAIAAYERTILANQAPFQRWLRGDQSAMTENQKNGAILFFGKANCVTCHDGPALAKNEFHALGMNDLDGPDVIMTPDAPRAALGRGGFTGNPDDNYKFKVPQLYNLLDSKFYGHGSSFTSVYQVVNYKNNALKQNPNVPDSQLSPHFVPLSLTKDEMLLITDFIENALYDPNLERYVPDYVPSGNCFPNNDQTSRVDLGCEDKFRLELPLAESRR